MRGWSVLTLAMGALAIGLVPGCEARIEKPAATVKKTASKAPAPVKSKARPAPGWSTVERLVLSRLLAPKRSHNRLDLGHAEDLCVAVPEHSVAPISTGVIAATRLVSLRRSESEERAQAESLDRDGFSSEAFFHDALAGPSDDPAVKARQARCALSRPEQLLRSPESLREPEGAAKAARAKAARAKDPSIFLRVGADAAESSAQRLGLPDPAMLQRLRIGMKAESEQRELAIECYQTLLAQVDPRSAITGELQDRLIGLLTEAGELARGRRQAQALVRGIMRLAPKIASLEGKPGSPPGDPRRRFRPVIDRAYGPRRGGYKAPILQLRRLALRRDQSDHSASKLPPRRNNGWLKAARERRRRALAKVAALYKQLPSVTAAERRELAFAYVLVSQPGLAAPLFESLKEDQGAELFALLCRSETANKVEGEALNETAFRLRAQSTVPRIRNASSFFIARRHEVAGRFALASRLFGRLARDPECSLRHEAAIAEALIQRGMIAIYCKEMLSHDGRLKLRISLRNVASLEFRFHEVLEALPLAKSNDPAQRARDFLATKAQEHGLRWSSPARVALPGGELARTRAVHHVLQLPKPGVFIVEARFGSLALRFPAVYRPPLSITIASAKLNSLIALRDQHDKALSGVELFSQDSRLGVTNQAGLLLTQSAKLHNFCDQCRGSCNGSRHCRRYWLKKSGGKSDRPGVTLAGSAPGVLFRTTVPIKPQSAPKDSPRDRIFVMTDRPIYAAGQSAFFRGILRRPIAELGTRPRRRYELLTGQKVQVRIKDGADVLFQKDFWSNDFGSFHGRWDIPANAPRKSLKLQVSCGKSSAAGELVVRDFRKPDHAITMTPTPGGFQVFAGFTWGLPDLRCQLRGSVGDREHAFSVDALGGLFIPAQPGELVLLVLERHGELLVSKQQRLPAAPPSAPAVSHPKGKVPAPISQAKPNSGPKGQLPKTPMALAGPPKKTAPGAKFKLRAISKTVRGGESIVLELGHSGGAPWKALVVLADQGIYDQQWINSPGPSRRVSFPVSGAYDPGLRAFVHFISGPESCTKSLSIRVRASLVELEIKTDKSVYEPGQEVEVELRTPGSNEPLESSLSVVDEAIFSLAQDCSPALYDFFYPPRDAALEFRRGAATFLGPNHRLAETPIALPDWPSVDVASVLYPLCWLKDGIAIRGSRSSQLRCDIYAREGGAVATERASQVSLRWSKRHQSPDGHWDSAGFQRRCQGASPCAGPGLASDTFSTALSLLAFTSNGHTHRFGSHKRSVQKALRFLMARAEDSQMATTKAPILDQALLLLSLAELYAMSRDIKLKKLCERGRQSLLSRRTPGSGWGFGRDQAPNVMATTWALMALNSCKLASLSIDATIYPEVLGLYDSLTDLRGRAWFAKRGSPARLPTSWRREEGDGEPEWTALALYGRSLCGQRSRDSAVQRGLALVAGQPPRASLGHRNFQYWFFATKALFAHRSGSWRLWSRQLLQVLIPLQRRQGCADGSVDPKGAWSGFFGRVGSTALSSLALGVYDRWGVQRGRFKQPKIRVHFPDSAYWNPSLVTSKGRASARFKLPDSISSFRLRARGVTRDTAVASATRWIRVRRDFFVKLKTPRFLVRGDRSQIHAELHNASGAVIDARLQLWLRGGSLKGQPSKQVHAPADGMPRRASWVIRTTSAERIELTLKASAQGFSDAVKLSIPVRSAGRRIAKSIKVLLAKGLAEHVIELPKEAQAASLELRLRPKSSPLYEVLETLRFLVKFPYGCVEQTMSRFLPAVAVAESLRDLKVKVPTVSFMGNFDAVTKAGIKRLAGFQNPDGGWGWFGDDPTHNFMTAYVVYGLSRARQASIQVDPSLIERGCEALRSRLPGETTIDLKAQMLYALACAEAPEAKAAASLAERKAELSSYALAMLALAQSRAGEEASARGVLAELSKRVVRDKDGPHFVTPKWFYRWEDVSIETTAYALLAFLELDAKSPLIPGLVTWLRAQKRGDRWKTTKDSAAACLGIIRYATRAGGTLAGARSPIASAGSKSPKASAPLPSRLRHFDLSLNGGASRPLSLDLNNPAASRFRLDFPGAELRHGLNSISLTGPKDPLLSGLQLLGTLRYQEAEPPKMGPAPRSGLELCIDWSDRRDVTAHQDLKVGQIVQVTAVLLAKRRADFLMVNLPIPAGAELVPGSAQGSFTAFEARFDQAVFFLTKRSPGTSRLRVSFRCRFPGRYSSLPAQVEPMYAPADVARAAQPRVRIKAP